MSLISNNETIDDYSMDVTNHSDIVNLIKQAIEEYENESIKIDKQKQLLVDLQIDPNTLDSSITKNVSEIAQQALLANSLNNSDIDIFYNNEIFRELKLEKKKWEMKQMILKLSQKNEKLLKQVEEFEKELEKGKKENTIPDNIDTESSKLEKKINELSYVIEKHLKESLSDLNVFEFKEDISKLLELRKRKESLMKQLSKYKGFSSDIVEATNQVKNLKLKLNPL